MDIRDQNFSIATRQSESPDFQVTRISTGLEQMQASAEEGLEAAETFNIYRAVDRQYKKWTADDIENPEKLNEDFPGMDIPFTKPMSKELAKSMWERKERQRKRQEVLANGEGGIMQGVANFGAMAVPQILDPVNIGMSFLSGAGVAKGLGMAARYGFKAKQLGTAARLQRAAQNLSKLSGYKRKGLELGLNVVGAGVSEMGIMYSTEADRMDYSMHDAVVNSLIGGLGFPLLFEGLGAGFKGAGKTAEFLSKSSPRFEKGMAYVENALALGKKFTLEKIAKATAQGEIPTLKRAMEKNIDEIDMLEARTTPLTKMESDYLTFRKQQLADQEVQMKELMDSRGVEPYSGRQVREEENAFENDLYGKKEDGELIRTMEQMADETEEAAELVMQTEYENIMKDLDSDIELDAASKAEMDSIKSDIKRIETDEEAIDIISNCVRYR